jgi:hypothetical protein
MSERKTVYIVQGATGEYSDYQDWFVCGFFDHGKAVALRDELEAKARELGLYDRQVQHDYSARQKAQKKMVAYDENAECDYTGITYFICECPVAV